jgi:acyl dehydratase
MKRSKRVTDLFDLYSELLKGETTVVEFDRSVLGKEFLLGTFPVTKEHIREFAEAVGDLNPLYVDEEAAQRGPYQGIIAPPTFYDVFRAEEAKLPDLKVQFGNVSYNAGQGCEYFLPIRAGDTITVKTRIVDVYEKTGRSGKMVFIVRETTYENQQQEKVMVVRQSMVRTLV